MFSESGIGDKNFFSAFGLKYCFTSLLLSIQGFCYKCCYFIFMKKKVFTTIEDLLNEESFRKWVFEEPGDHITFWENWIAENQDKQALVEKAILILEGLSFKFKTPTGIPPKVIRTEWQKLRNKAFKEEPALPKPMPDNQRLHWVRTKAWSIAASVAVLVVAGFLLQYFVLNPTISYTTPFGEQLSIVLPDSSQVELNANSTIKYRKQNPRRVWLDGEAFFKVKKKPAINKNFLVVANDLTVEVLGTSFNVIEKEDKTEVVLEEGSVKLNLNRDFQQEVYMKPGELVAFSASANKEVEKREVEPQLLTSWKDGILEFKDVSLQQVMERIEEIYGWKTIYQDEALKTRKVAVPLPSNDLESVLILLNKAIGVKIEKVHEDNVLLLN